MTVAEVCAAGSMMILAALILRVLGKRTLPRWTMPVLWNLAALRLLLPWAIPSPVSVLGLLEAALRLKAGTVERAAVENGTAAAGALPVLSNVPSKELLAATHSPSPLSVIWMVGTAVCIAVLAAVGFTRLRSWRESLPVEDPAVLEFLKEHPLRRTLRIRQSDRITTPLTYGLFRPVILLPARRDWSGEEQLCVLTHEYVHIRHLDALSKLVILAAFCIHWYNPLVWAMVILANRDLELWCDEQTVHMLGQAQRKAYALTLIRLEENRAQFFSLPSYFNTNPIKERIELIMKTKQIPRLVTGFALLLVIGVSAVFATSAFAEAFSDSAPEQVNEGAPVISREVAESYLDTYGAFGLTYDSNLQQFRYDGKLVRYFEDMYPLNEDGSEQAGTVIQMPDGEVDVYSVRDFSHLEQNADGSYDPSGKLTGLREATQEEFDNVTKLLEENKLFVDKGKSYAGEAASSSADAVDIALSEGSREETAVKQEADAVAENSQAAYETEIRLQPQAEEAAEETLMK